MCRTASALTTTVLTVLSTLVAAPAGATSDASVDGPGDGTVVSGPHRDASDEGIHQTFRVCTPLTEALGTPDAPTRLVLAIDAPWAHSISEMTVVGDLSGNDDLSANHVFARIAGEAWEPFAGILWVDVPDEGECPPDTACDAQAASLFGRLPALTRVPTPFTLELAREDEAQVSLSSVCLEVTAYETEVPGPLFGPSSQGSEDPPGVDAFYDFWEDAPDAGHAPRGDGRAPADAEFPRDSADAADSAISEATRGPAERPAESPAEAGGEKAGCSAAAGRGGSPVAALMLLLAPLGLRRGRRYTRGARQTRRADGTQAWIQRNGARRASR